MGTGVKVLLAFVGVAALGGITYLIVKKSTPPPPESKTTTTVSEGRQENHKGFMGWIEGFHPLEGAKITIGASA